MGADNGNVVTGRQHARRGKGTARMARGVRVSGAMLPPHTHGVAKSPGSEPEPARFRRGRGGGRSRGPGAARPGSP
jgi:hypothetical protein